MAVLGVEGLDAAEVEFLGIGWDGAEEPVGAAVGGVEDGAVRSRRPRRSEGRDGVDAAQVGGGVGGLESPLGLNAGRDAGRTGGRGAWREFTCVAAATYVDCAMKGARCCGGPARNSEARCGALRFMPVRKGDSSASLRNDNKWAKMYLTWFAFKADSNCFKLSSIGGKANGAVPLDAHLMAGCDALRWLRDWPSSDILHP